MRLIPLRRRDGMVRCYALVDDEDYALVAGRRWCLHKRGYAVHNTSVAGRRRTFLLHRVLMGLEYGDPREVDHRNGRPLDCRRSNMRVVSHAGNGQNLSYVRGRSRFRNVSWHARRGRWQVVLGVSGRRRHLGYFADELDAARVAAARRRELMPFAGPDPEFERALEELARVA